MDWEKKFEESIRQAEYYAGRCSSVADAGKIYAEIAKAIAKSGLLKKDNR